jgi:hypothetical protein
LRNCCGGKQFGEGGAIWSIVIVEGCTGPVL